MIYEYTMGKTNPYLPLETRPCPPADSHRCRTCWRQYGSQIWAL